MFTLPASGRIRSTTLPAAAAVVSLLAATPQVAAHTGQKLVTCTVSTTPGRPITLDPPVSMTVRRITARATLALTHCTSPNGAHARLRSGWLTAHGTGLGSCTNVDDISATGRITWYDADKRPAGTSVIKPDHSAIEAARSVKSYNPGDMLLGGKVTKGRLAGASVAGSAIPTSDITTCTTTGIAAVTGTGKISFIA
ncbi:hypothetical protein [Nonomuraea sp. NPDC003214]